MKDGQAGGDPEDSVLKDGVPKDGAPKGGNVFLNPVFWAMSLGIAFSLVVFKRYIDSEELSDEGLYRLLAFLRYSAFFVCVCSLYLFIASVARMIKRPGAGPVIKIILFLSAALYGAGVVVFTFFITVIAGGNN
jgi:hypothetical protein